MHVDDDLIVASPWLETEILPKLRRRFHYGKWSTDNFVHCGREYAREADGSVVISQVGYAQGLEKGEACSGEAPRSGRYRQHSREDGAAQPATETGLVGSQL